jgi:hypothetical protein
MREGGSIPIVNVFKKILGADSLLLGLALPDDNAHSPNEKFNLDCFFKGQLMSAHLWQEWRCRTRGYRIANADDDVSVLTYVRAWRPVSRLSRREAGKPDSMVQRPFPRGQLRSQSFHQQTDDIGIRTEILSATDRLPPDGVGPYLSRD